MGGIVRDERVFHMDSSDWLEKLQLQGAPYWITRVFEPGADTDPHTVQLELTAFGGWPDGDPESVKEAAVKLQAEKGWKAMRMAVGSTIRCVRPRQRGATRCCEGDVRALTRVDQGVVLPCVLRAQERPELGGRNAVLQQRRGRARVGRGDVGGRPELGPRAHFSEDVRAGGSAHSYGGLSGGA